MRPLTLPWFLKIVMHFVNNTTVKQVKTDTKLLMIVGFFKTNVSEKSVYKIVTLHRNIKKHLVNIFQREVPHSCLQCEFILDLPTQEAV